MIPGCDWRQEFGEGYEVPDEIAKSAELVDLSWHNDASPSFCLREHASDEDAVPSRIWAEHPDPALREAEGGARFVTTVGWRDEVHVLYAGDDPAKAVRALLAVRESGGPIRAIARGVRPCPRCYGDCGYPNKPTGCGR